MKIGVMFGNPETTTGGFALKFYSSIRFDIRKVEMIMRGGEKDGTAIGIKTRVKCVKNKTAVPMRKIELNILFEDGLDTFGEYIDFAVVGKIIDKAGSWYSYGKERLGQGTDNVIKFFKENPSLYKEIQQKVNVLNNFPEMKEISVEVPEEPKERKPRTSNQATGMPADIELSTVSLSTENEIKDVT